MKAMITIQAKHHKSGKIASHEISADLFGPLAVHRDMGSKTGYWRVTLTAMGWSVAGRFDTKKEAETVARVFRVLFDWSGLTTDAASQKAFLAANQKTMLRIKDLLSSVWGCKTAMQGALAILAEVERKAL